MKILNTIGPQFNAEAKKILEHIGEIDYQSSLNQSGIENSFDLGKFEVWLVDLRLYIHRGVIDRTKYLKVIATATTGLDHIDVGYAKEKGIAVLSLQDADLKEVTGTAELAFGLMLALVRHIPQAFADVKGGDWNREKFLGHNLYGKTLGIVGLGRLGSIVAQYGRTFGMKVIAYDPYHESSEVARFVSFATLLSESDFVSIHAPLTRETENMFNEPAFGKMKSTAYLINTARGAIVNEADLLKALENKKIAGYAADVLADEKYFGKSSPEDNPLVKYAKTHDNLIITPHIGGMTYESRAATDIIIAKKIQKWAQTL